MARRATGERISADVFCFSRALLARHVAGAESGAS